MSNIVFTDNNGIKQVNVKALCNLMNAYVSDILVWCDIQLAKHKVARDGMVKFDFHNMEFTISEKGWEYISKWIEGFDDVKLRVTQELQSI